ncbi:L,D-transpeptidase family protein [Oryzomonas sagensis]|uniref:L,D-transpeptidase family protein n=1 Tax=Oryzomonas sagensis TaxID=2603857 RepID=A0ABQ6TQI0_9BACT|nr:L,D-transpeptidase family protein [Oryzomonas sagensis]KAB0671054.1 L,D-transpeptidase family protein [Oryzomonas sagensis]
MKFSALPRISVMGASRLVSIAALFLITPGAWADTRQDALLAVSHLRSSGFGRQMPDEMKSVDDTFSLAERHHQRHEHDMAERYYLLTLQKVRVIQATLPAIPPAETAGSDQPRNAAAAPEPAFRPEAVPAPPVTAAPAGPLPGTTPEQTLASQEPAVSTRDDAPPAHDDFVSAKVVGSANVYTVVKGDTLRLVAAKLGVSRQHLIAANRLDAKVSLKTGQRLKYNNRKIIPQRMKDGIVVNIPDRTLYYFRQGKLVTSLPVAVGTGKKSDKFDWQTPVGKFKVTGKQKDPTWHVPASIRSEMEEEGREVITSIPPGPGNPLGRYAIKTSIPGILIHSTIKPWSIYGFASHGCIRVSPLRMEGFFNEVKVNTPGEIIYKPVKVAVTEQGRILLEVHQDVYKKGLKPDVEAWSLIRKYRLSERIDRDKVEAVIRQRSGIAEDISL